MRCFDWVKKHRQFVLYTLYGTVTTILNIGIYFVLSFFFGSELYQLWNVIAWIASVIYSYSANKRRVFKVENNEFILNLKNFFKFVYSRVFSLALEILGLFLTVSVFEFNDKVSKILLSFIVALVNYYYCKKIFKD